MTPVKTWHITITLSTTISEDEAFNLLEALSSRGAAISFGKQAMVVSMTGFGSSAADGANDAVRLVRTALSDANIREVDAQSYEQLDEELAGSLTD